MSTPIKLLLSNNSLWECVCLACQHLGHGHFGIF